MNYWQELKARKALNKFSEPYKLNIGCGKVAFPGWINIDIANIPDLVDIIWDASQGFPFIKDNSCNLIYNEHFLEHLDILEASKFLSESFRILKTGGIVRIAMPSLENIVHKYSSEEWRDQAWLQLDEYQQIKTRGEMINIAFRWWGHRWLYDREELSRRLNEAGFVHIKYFDYGSSNIPELMNLETRPDSLLIAEASK
ncbi:methyltransferase domain-containing protein [Anabaenopsis sp. FSS-46]|uniref:class I SAM-dependent methyltransferase n=1 Tax=Anabaenopsis sp. FSS-46 TaxID=2971766 RepID=UPI002476AEC9|nr:methyltransferase domain-containing protein [Anabaenopsis sp. FSS-46]MDH6100737.1 methyltransferase domain-containing protein [Anabaenopsis sp. FSS-46]